MDTQSGRAISARYGEQNLYSGVQSADSFPAQLSVLLQPDYRHFQ